MYFLHFILHHFSTLKYFRGLALAQCQYCNVRYRTGYEPVITFSRCNQILFVGRGILYLIICSVHYFYHIRYKDSGVQS